MVIGPPGDELWPTIGHLVRSAAAEFDDRTAIVDGDLRISYREFGRQVDEVGRGLLAAGVERGDRVAIWGPNSAGWLVVAAASATVGAAIVPLNTRFKADEAHHVLRATGARVLFTVSGFLDLDFLGLIRGLDLPALRRRVLLSGPAEPDAVSLSAFVAGGSAVPRSDVDARLDTVSGTDVADIMFSSGTTGRPKGALISHAQDLKGYRDEAYHLGMRPGDVLLLTNPLFHAFGYKTCALAALMTGTTLVPMAIVDPPLALRLIERERVTLLAGPPTMYLALMEAESFPRTNLSSVRAAVCGSTSVPAELFARIRRAFGLQGITSGYGMTESSGVATFFPLDVTDAELASSVGPPLRDVRLRIVDVHSGHPLPDGETGEILIGGYPVMSGYLDAPERTREVIDGEGWLHTGDVGRLDGRNLVVTGRLKDMFICGGFNAYPAEIEQILTGHPVVGAAAVVGVPDSHYGEVGFAFVVPARDAVLAESELLDWARSRMANFKLPRGVAFLPELPLTANGKVRKTDLVEQARRIRATASAAGDAR